MTFSEKYYEGQIAAVSTNPADDLRAAIASAIVGVTGWSVVDDAYGDTWIKRSVLKLASATSGLATDMYVTLVHSTTAATTNLFAYVSEGYDTGTHLLSYTAQANASTDSSCRFTTASPWLTATGTSSNGIQGGDNNYGGGLIIATEQGGYWCINAYADHLVISTSTTNRIIYFGKFTSLVTNPNTNDLNPICMSHTGTTVYTQYYSAWSTITNGTFFTRWAMNPSYTHSTLGATYDWTTCGYTITPYAIGQGTLSQGYFSNTTDPYSGNTGAVFVPLIIQNNAHNNPTLNYGTSKGVFRGKLIDVVGSPSTTVSWGDTITISGNTWQFVSGGYAFRKTA